jgi:hypothetical protein
MVNLDIPAQHFTYAHSVEENAGFVVVTDTGLCGLVLMNLDNKDNAYFCSCVILWEDGDIVITSIEEECSTIEEWCFQRGYKLGAVYASHKDYTITIGTKAEQIF